MSGLELGNDPAYSGKDFATLKLTVLDSYELSIKDVDKAITNLQRYITANKELIETFKDEQLVNRIQLAKMIPRLLYANLCKWEQKKHLHFCKCLILGWAQQGLNL
ncbi:MAG: hypothetical protein PHT07_24555 [Paludibacter sp.]|nr:hypothetical protein [Paludibacter sp.]